MEVKEIESAIEGILFAAGDPVGVERLCMALDLDRARVEAVCHRLADYYRSQRHFETEIPLSPQVFDGAVDRDMPDFSVQMEVSQSLSQKDSETAAWEIEAANQQLSPYGFSLTDLCVPHAEKPRRDCARAAAVLLQCPELMAQLRRLPRLPESPLRQSPRHPDGR